MSTLQRVVFAIQQALSHRAALLDIRKNALRSVADINLSQLRSDGIESLIFDYDGILASHGKPAPDAMGIDLLNTAQTLFEHVAILSNKPNETRKAYFAKHYPAIDFIVGKRKKPYPDGINEILTKTTTAPKNTCIIDDRLTTGCLAGVLCNVNIVYVSHPKTDYAFDFFSELFFDTIRRVERLIF